MKLRHTSSTKHPIHQANSGTSSSSKKLHGPSKASRLRVARGYSNRTSYEIGEMTLIDKLQVI